jgi:PadR family transcriptional regulator AphA
VAVGSLSEHEPSLAEAVCLVLTAQGVDHGWAIGSLLAPDGELGRIWSLSRPLTYRALDSLASAGLITRAESGSGKGRDRVVLSTTPLGRRTADRWLDRPCGHIRDLRTELLLKLVLRRRAGLGIEALLGAQERELAEALDSLAAPGSDDDVVALWRQENARAVRRFLRQARELASGEPVAAPGSPVRRSEVRLSARNQLRTTIDTVVHGDVMSSIKTVLPDGQRLTAAITSDAADELDLASGDEVIMIIKSTEIMVAKATGITVGAADKV